MIRRLLAAVSVAAAVAIAQSAPLNHPIVTHNTAAQADFDRGLSLIYAFNFKAAEHAFQQAAELDPTEAMPYWGMALALGPNLNARRPSPLAEQAATNALARASELAAQLPGGAPADEERGLIAALQLRLSCDPEPAFGRLEQAYGAAMQSLSARFPDDPDVATLSAESMMEQRSWAQWVGGNAAGPSSGKILAALQAILRRWPNHLGANHFYIHAAESAGTPALALDSAARIENLARGIPGGGHLLHMPAHVYLRTGQYAEAERAGLAAAAADRAYVHAHPDDADYTSMYLPHNLSFLIFAASMDGDYAVAMDAARQISRDAQLGEASGNAAAAAVPISLLVQFGQWGEIQALPAPDGRLEFADNVWWHYARASAFAASGDLQSALAESRAMDRAVPARPMANAATLPKQAVMIHLRALLTARIAVARGNWDLAASQLASAVAVEEKIPLADPPRWPPLYPQLGAALLRAGKPEQALAIVRQGLVRFPGDPRGYFVLAEAYTQLGKRLDADSARNQYLHLWKGSPLTLADF